MSLTPRHARSFWAAALLLGLTVSSCRDNPARPNRGGAATLAIHPEILSHVDLAGFGLVVDSLRLVVVRTPADTLKDTTAFFNPDSTALRLPITVALRQPAETLSVSVVLSASGVRLFTGTQKALVAIGSPASASVISVPLSFTGPGAGVTALHVSPVDSVLHFGDSLRFRVSADSAGTPVTSFYVSWHSDTTIARISAFGVLHAPAARRSLYVVVRTLSGAVDSTPITFVPTPTLLSSVGGASQTGAVGGPLPQPLRARVTAADGLGVKGIPVQFSTVSGGGYVTVGTVVTDTGGYAQTVATLGTVAGAASYQATSAGLTSVTFVETGVAGPPTQLLANAGTGQTAVAGSVVPTAPAVVAKDTFNNVVPGVAVTYAVPGGRGKVTGGADTTNVSGVATVGSWTLDTIARVDSVVATAGALSRVFTATGTPGPASVLRSLVTVSVDTIPSGTASTITLRARDQYANNLPSGGLTVAFTATGGTSTGNLSGVTDHADGTYTATFTGVLVGTADTVHATIGGIPVTSALPTLRVLPGIASTANSILTVASAVDSSGRGDTLTLKTKDGAGNSLTSGGLTVVFTRSGGTSRGAIGATSDHGNGTYTAVFVGDTAGTATTIGATIGGSAVTSTQSVSVVPGVVSLVKSTVTASQGTVAVGAKSILTLQAKDAAGNNQVSGGLVVVFADTLGTSSATIAPVPAHDNGNGTYTDTLTGLLPGTPTTVHATIGGAAVTATTAITVVLGNVITATSVVTVDSATLASGDSTLLHLQAKDSLGNSITSGGLTVVFTDSGGTSTGTVGATTDHANGAYTAVFHGLLAGTATTIHATINGLGVTSTLPQVTVTPGAPSPATSVVTVPVDSIASGAGVLLTIQLKDAAGNNLATAGGAAVVFSATGGTSTGTIVPATAAFAGAGTDTSRFTGVIAGTPDSIKATVGGTAVTTTHPLLHVFPGAFSLATSKVTVSDSIVTAGGIDTLLLTVKDAAGNQLSTGGLTVLFTLSGGTSTGSIGGTSNLGNGLYRAIFTGITGGTAVSVGATIGGSPVTSALPTIRVTTTVHIANILADSTWTAAASPHIVHGYLKVANGATLTIQPGAVVKFDTASGLQVGDTASAQAGGLTLAGTALQPITLTADSTGIRLGFWRGIEVQRLLAPTTWTHVLAEGAGGTRTLLSDQSCFLISNASGAALTADSLHVRQCNNGGIVLFGGALTVHRSQVDTASGAGVQALVAGVLTLDSTAVRGSGGSALSLATPGPNGPFLTQAVGNVFTGNGISSAQPAVNLSPLHLPHFGVQDSIAGNFQDYINVGPGNLDSSVASVTLLRQPLAAQYHIVGSLFVGAPGGQTLTLDSNVVVRFDHQVSLIIGDSSGNRSGVLRSLATGRGNGALLTSAQSSPAAGDWVGLEFGRLAAPDTLVGIHVQFAGDSIPGYTQRRAGIWARNPTANELVITDGALASNGSLTAINSSYGVFVSGSGGGVHIYGTVAANTAGSAFAYSTTGVRLVGDTALGSSLMGLVDFVPSGTNLSPADSVAQSQFTSGFYPALVPVGVLPAFYASNSWNGNVRDTLLMAGGALVGQSVTFPRVRGVPWRFLAQVTTEANAGITFAAGDTVTFDSSAAIIVGDSLAGFGTLTAIGSDTAPILFTATPGFGYWHGIQYVSTPGGDTTLRNVTVDGAGYFQPCPIIDCNGQPIGAIRVIGNLNENLIFDSITVRNSVYYAIEAVPNGIEGVVLVRHGQFYDNPYGILFLASDGRIFTVDSSDIYHYAASGGVLAVVNEGGTSDSVLAQHNWWGDVTGPGAVGFVGADSIGRALLDTADYGVTFRPFATQPYFPVGPTATVVATPDSTPFSNTQVGVALDSIRARAIDAFGRGVPLQSITWTPAPGSGGVVPGGLATDSGGRAGALWTPTTASKQDTVTATSGSNSARLFVFMSPGPEAAVHWQYVPALTEGTVPSTLDTATFTASGHVGVIITNAHDAFGNVVQPTSLYFDSLPASGVAQPLAVITKESGDTIWFVDTANVTVPFQLHATYNFIPGVSPPADSAVIVTASVPVAIHLRADTTHFSSICPTLPGNVFCSQAVTADVIDSAGKPLAPSGQTFYQWTAPPGMTLDSTGGPSGTTAFVTANANGLGSLIVTQQIGVHLPTWADTGVVVAQQVAGQIGVTPDTLSTGIGDTVGLHALVADSGGTALTSQPPLQWQITSQFPGLVKLDSAADSLQVRFDSGVYNFGTFNWVGVARPFTELGPGDTLFGQGTLFNPIHYELPFGTGCSEGGCFVAVDTVAGKVFWSDPGSDIVHVNQTSNNNAFDIINVGSNPHWLAVSHAGGADKLYVSNDGDGTVSVVDPVGEITLRTVTLPAGFTPFGITAADPLGRMYVAATFCNPLFPACAGVFVVPIDVATDSPVMADTVHLVTDPSRFPQGIAFNRNNGLLYVAMDSGYVKVVNPVTKTEVATIMVDPGFTLSDIVVNNATDTVYVADSRGNIGVIDPTTGTLVNTLPANSPNGMGVDEARNRIYYASTGNQSIIQIDGSNENYHTLLVGGSSPNPSAAVPDPRTGTVFAPHGSGMAIYQFYGAPVGFLPNTPAPPVRPLRVVAQTQRLAPLVRSAVPKAKVVPQPAVKNAVRRAAPTVVKGKTPQN